MENIQVTLPLTTPRVQRPGVRGSHGTSQNLERPENVGKGISSERGGQKHLPCHGSSRCPEAFGIRGRGRYL